MCNICNQYNCCCNSFVATNTKIISDQAGRDGLSAKEILIKIGKLPSNASDEDFSNYIKGGTTIENKQIYTKADW